MVTRTEVQSRPPLEILKLLGLSALAALLAVGLSGLPASTIAVVLLLPLVLIGWLALPAGLKSYAAVAALGLALPFNVKETLGPVEQVADQYVPNIGGASGIHVSAHLLATLAILAGFAVDYGQGRRQRLLRIEPWITTAFTTIAVCGAFSLLNARVPLLTVLEIVRFGTLTLTMIVVASFDRTQIRIFTGCFAVAVLVEAGIVALQFMLGRTLGISVLGETPLVQEMINFSLSPRPTGTIGNTNMMAYFFEMAAPVMLALALAEFRWHRWIFFVAFGAAALSLVMSQSRASWIPLPITTAFILYTCAPRIRLTRKRLILLCTIGVGALLVVALAAPFIMERLTADDAGSASHRMPLNRAAWSIIEQFPVFGIGFNNFADAFPRYDATGYARTFIGLNHVVHNMYLLTWAETGTFGLLALLTWFSAILVLAARNGFAAHDDADMRALSFGVGAGLLAHMIHGLFDPGLQLSLVTSNLTVCFAGLIGAISLNRAEC